MATGVLLAGCASTGTLGAGPASGGAGGTLPKVPSISHPAPTDGGSSAPSTDSPSTSDSGGAPSSDGASSSAVLTVKTGTQLKALFPANSQIPKPWSRYEQSALDSGDKYDDYTSDPLFIKDPCPAMANTPLANLLSGLRVSDAKFQLQQVDEPGLQVDLEAAGYGPGDAQKQLKDVKDRIAACPAFQGQDFIAQKNVGYTEKITPLPGIADEAYEIVLAPDNASTFGDDLVLARKGDVLFGGDVLTQDKKGGIDMKVVLKAMADNDK